MIDRHFQPTLIFTCLIIFLLFCPCFSSDNTNFFINPNWKIGDSWTICQWVCSGSIDNPTQIDLRGGKVFYDCLVVGKERVNGILCWKLLIKERETYQIGYLLASQYWLECGTMKLLKLRNCNYTYGSRENKNPYYGDEIMIKDHPTNCNYGIPISIPSLVKKNIFNLKDRHGVNQVSEHDPKSNCWKITIASTNEKIKSPINLSKLSDSEKIKYLRPHTKTEYTWKNNHKWWSECKFYSGGVVYSIWELVTPEWKEKYGKVEN